MEDIAEDGSAEIEEPEVWASEVEAVELYLDAVNQWAWVATPGGPIRTGLDMARVEVLARARGIALGDVIDGLLILEGEGLRAFAEMGA